MGIYHNCMAKEKLILPEFAGTNAKEGTRWVNKI
jgi:hypothetical protein